MPFKAKTNKETWLMRLGGQSIWLPANQPLDVYGEDSGWGSVGTQYQEQTVFGSVDSDDYDRV